MEYATDEILVYLVRAEKLAQSISLALASRNLPLQGLELPLSIIVRSYQQEIELFKTSLPPRIRDNPSVIGHWHTAEILLYEIGMEQTDLSLPDRLEYLWSCVNAAKAFFTNRFASPVADQPRFNCISSADLTYVLHTCLKLIMSNIPGWDLNQVRKELAFEEFVNLAINELRHVVDRRKKRGNRSSVNERNSAVGEDPFELLGRKLTWLKAAVLGELEKTSPTSLEQADTPIPTIADAGNDILDPMWQSITTSHDPNAYGALEFWEWTY
jgi:hypothetical protein